MVEHKNRKKENPDKEGVKCRCLSRRCGRAGPGRAEAGGDGAVGMVQSSTPSHL